MDLINSKTTLISKYNEVKTRNFVFDGIVTGDMIKELLSTYESCDDMDTLFELYTLLMSYINKYEVQMHQDKMTWSQL